MTDPEENKDMVDWISKKINSGELKSRGEVESYILANEGTISQGMARALDEFFANYKPVVEPPVEPQPPDITESEDEPESIARSIYRRLRGLFQ